MKLTIPFELPLEVQYTAFKASKGAMDSLCGVRVAGPPLEPDEPASVEIDAVRCNGVLVRLTEAQMEELEELVLSEHEQLSED